ncbi:MAG: PKD domain-containing protein [Atribacterota bacterium]
MVVNDTIANITIRPLVADAGGPYNGAVGEMVYINGTASGGYPPYNYSWDLDDDGKYDNAYGNETTYSWDAVGLYNISLKVKDSGDNESINHTTVNISYVELIADAGGPYQGKVDENIKINGSAEGGVPPYSFSWDLDDDGQYDDGNEKNVTYSWNKPGNYTIKLKVVDDADDQAFNETIVTILGKPLLKIDIIRPKTNRFYFRDRQAILLRIPLIIGFITIKAKVEAENEVEKVEFYIDNHTKANVTEGENGNYSWTWNERAFAGHTIKVIVIDVEGNKAEDSTSVCIINFRFLSWWKS